jgi:integrase
VSGEIAVGRNPQTERREAKRARLGNVALAEVWDAYTAVSGDGDKWFWGAVTWQSRRLDAIALADVKALHRKIGTDSPAMANRVAKLLRRLFNFAKEELGYKGDNPVVIRSGKRGAGSAGITLFKETSRKRYLLPGELPAFFTAIKADLDPDFVDFIFLLLFTGARRSNVLAMEWGEVDFTAALWTIPGKKAKANEDILVPLAERRDESPWVFPSATAKSGHMEYRWRQWADLLKRAGITNLRMHDLRRTLATYERTAGFTMEAIGPGLGHRSLASTAVYARVDLGPVRDAIEGGTAKLLEAAGQEHDTTGGVVPPTE